MRLFELKTKNGRIYKVMVENNNQYERLLKLIQQNKEKGGYEMFISVKNISNGIQNIADFEAICKNLV